MLHVSLRGHPRREEPEWIVLLLVVVSVGIGWLIHLTVASPTHTATIGDMAVSYPAGWTQVVAPGSAFAAADILRGGTFAPSMSVREVATSDLVDATGAGASLTALSDAWSLDRAKDLSAFRTLQRTPVSVQGRPAIEVDYAYVAEAGPHDVPTVMRGADTLVPSGNKVAILTFTAPSDAFDQLSGERRQLLDSWKVP